LCINVVMVALLFCSSLNTGLMDDTARLLEQLLVRVMLPLWMLAGLADWACHRVQRIEHSAGLKESWLHLAMLVELGAGIVAALALQPTAALLAVLLMACIAHELTTWWDIAYASAQRGIPPYEQWVHSIQIALPWACRVTLMVAHRDQALALAGLGDAAVDWRLRPRDSPLPAWGWAAVLLGSAFFVVLPLWQEHLRCKAAQAKSAIQLRHHRSV
jgi:hypothetical protein